MFKKFSEAVSTMRGLSSLQKHLQDLPRDLSSQRVTGLAGGGMVEVEMTGSFDIVKIRIAPELAGKGDHEMIEDLVMAACNQASEKARGLSQELVGKAIAGLPIKALTETEGNADEIGDGNDQFTTAFQEALFDMVQDASRTGEADEQSAEPAEESGTSEASQEPDMR